MQPGKDKRSDAMKSSYTKRTEAVAGKTKALQGSQDPQRFLLGADRVPLLGQVALHCKNCRYNHVTSDVRRDHRKKPLLHLEREPFGTPPQKELESVAQERDVWDILLGQYLYHPSLDKWKKMDGRIDEWMNG
ncbi:unnamed protein product [Pleuronectes platessa]|uniref:Uncharacterized protein n=1 Tax=Pleuronectes platessa TaxID=8262 RepID=A0A9N7UIA3_PLEPL|nr:unnamed protein product [Pleuronectes platessa]